MKKIFFAAAACLVLFSCNNKQQMETPKPDAIEVTPRTATFGVQGGTADVIVTSNADWTLTSDAQHAWVTPSKSEGKDGEIVTFTVDQNTTADVQAVFTFKSGIETTTFTVFSYAGEIPVPTFELVSDAELSLGFESEQVEISLTSSATHYRDIDFTLSEGAEEWLTYQATLPGETEMDAKIYFKAADLEGLADRDATVTITAPGFEPVVVGITQFAKHVLSVDSNRYTIAKEGETITIPVTSNIEYAISVEGAEGWLTYTSAEASISFTAVALESGKRSAKVTLTQTDAEEGEEPLKFEFTITQLTALINWAADMTGNRLFPKWDGPDGGMAPTSVATLECLVKFDDFDKANGGIFTIMGIEGTFLLRTGDTIPLTNIELATSVGNYDFTDFTLEANEWYHIALVWGEDRIAKLYINGELKGTSTQFPESKYVGWPTYGYVKINPLNLSPKWSYEPDGTRAFWMGYSYDAARDLHGKMTEIRIWNKALTADEINADDHFYTVDPKSEGLFSYWKFTEGSGETIADATGRGNSLYGETDVAKQSNGDNKGSAGIEWVEVSLPDR